MTSQQKIKQKPFHLAFPVHDLSLAREFYLEVLGCRLGRESDRWIDFDLYGNQIVAHFDPGMKPNKIHNLVDGHQIPVPHFGAVLSWKEWEALGERIRSKSISFIVEPYVRFKGKAGEQGTMFFQDPSGNNLEFKAFKNSKELFKMRL